MKVLKYNGNIGIGTVSPSAKLDVAGNITVSSGGRHMGNGSVPSGMIAFFAGDCPVGWSNYTALRGRAVVGTPLVGTILGTSAGTVGTALTDLQNLTHTHTGPSHTHTVDIWATDKTGTILSEGAVSRRHLDDTGANRDWDHESGPTSANSVGKQETTAAGGTGATWADGTGATGGTSLTSDAAGTGATGADGTGATGTAATSNVIPYIQLTACQAP